MDSDEPQSIPPQHINNKVPVLQLPQREKQMPDLNQHQKGASLLERVAAFEAKKQMTIADKRKIISAAREYKKKREGVIQKQIEKEKKIQGLIPCSKPGCNEFFKDAATLSRHIEKMHKIFSDQIGNRLHECELCKTTYLKKAWLKRHEMQCYQKQKMLLKAQGKYEDEDDLDTDEELEYQDAKNYN